MQPGQAGPFVFFSALIVPGANGTLPVPIPINSNPRAAVDFAVVCCLQATR